MLLLLLDGGSSAGGGMPVGSANLFAANEHIATARGVQISARRSRNLKLL
jgi:F0F1-type ATP synthase membrane subunit c/vacuolar-type H+-ATPase subunit K